jgi:hypothetical protein
MMCTVMFIVTLKNLSKNRKKWKFRSLFSKIIGFFRRRSHIEIFTRSRSSKKMMWLCDTDP